MLSQNRILRLYRIGCLDACDRGGAFRPSRAKLDVGSDCRKLKGLAARLAGVFLLRRNRQGIRTLQGGVFNTDGTLLYTVNGYYDTDSGVINVFDLTTG